MPKYYFHVYDGYPEPDETGIELPDIYTAQTEAIQVSGEIIRDMGAKFWNDPDWRLEVTDEQMNVCFILRLSAEKSPLPPTQSEAAP